MNDSNICKQSAVHEFGVRVPLVIAGAESCLIHQNLVAGTCRFNWGSVQCVLTQDLACVFWFHPLAFIMSRLIKVVVSFAKSSEFHQSS